MFRPHVPLAVVLAVALACNGGDAMSSDPGGPGGPDDPGETGETDQPCDETTVCETPPDSACSGDTTLVTFAADGTCIDEGTCTYESSEEPCPHGCRDGRCLREDELPQPCEDSGGKVCESPPGDVCVDADKLGVYSDTGQCVNNVCDYELTEQPCPLGCRDDACRDASAFGEHRDGTRLTSVSWESPGGNTQHETWLDTELGIECNFFAPLESIDRRCLPRQYAGFSFADEDCTQPITTHIEDPGPYVMFTGAMACDNGAGITWPYRVLPGSGRSVDHYYSRFAPGGDCNRVELAVTAFDLERAELATFVKGTSHQIPLDSNLGRLIVEGADGSAEWQWLYRTDLGQSCGVVNERCVISAVRNSRHHSDADCTAGDIALEFKTCSVSNTPEVAVGFQADRFFELTEIEPNDVFHTKSSECVPGTDTVTPLARVYKLGAEVPASRFPRVVETPLGVGRLRPIYWSTEAGTTIFSRAHLGWRDTELDHNCTTTRTTAGPTRCLPQDTVWFPDREFYTDDSCTGPRLFLTSTAPTTDTLIEFTPERVARSTWTITGPHAGDVFRKLPGQPCGKISTSQQAFTITPLPLSTFPELTRTAP